MNSTFRLQNYVSQIRQIASENRCGAAQAVRMMITNLNVMHEHYKGASDLNYHQLGQQWNALRYKERNKQQQETIALVAKNIPMMSMRAED